MGSPYARVRQQHQWPALGSSTSYIEMHVSPAALWLAFVRYAASFMQGRPGRLFLWFGADS